MAMPVKLSLAVLGLFVSSHFFSLLRRGMFLAKGLRPVFFLLSSVAGKLRVSCSAMTSDFLSRMSFFSLIDSSFLDNKTYIDDMILIDGESLFLLVCGGGFIGDVIANR